MTPRAFLKSSIAFARHVERSFPRGRLKSHRSFVGFGLMIRQLRLATAIDALGTRHAYEGRMLLRSMIEILINHSWIRTGHGHSRALRFIRFEPLERREVVREVAAVLPGPVAEAALNRFSRERAETRHLFRLQHPKTGKRFWAKSWASKSALPDRLIEVLRHDAAKSGKPVSDTFMYGLYRWTSSAVHGGPLSVSEVITKGKRGVTAKAQPESDPTAQLLAAGMMLVAAIDRLTADARCRRQYRARLSSLVKAMHVLKEAKRRGA